MNPRMVLSRSYSLASAPVLYSKISDMARIGFAIVPERLAAR
jgi:hypothetical protein